MSSPLKVQVIMILAVGMSLLVALHYIGILRPVEATITFALKPMERWIYTTANRWGLSRWDGRGASPDELERENQILRDQVNNFLVENLRLKERLLAMQAVEQQMAFLDGQGLFAVQAAVIGRSSDQVSSSLLLNQGANQNIRVGMPVIVKNGIFIGKISEVEPNTSKVQLLTTSGSKTSGVVLGEKEVQGIVEGHLGLSLELGFVLQSETIRPNDVVVTSGAEDMIPKHLVIGTLTEVERLPGELWQSATLLPLVQSSEISIVSIIQIHPTQ